MVKCPCTVVEHPEGMEAVCQGNFMEWEVWLIINGFTVLPVVSLYDGEADHVSKSRLLLVNVIFPLLCYPLLLDIA